MGTDSSTWHWLDQSALSYDNWDPLDAKQSGQACARIVSTYDYLWLDSMCDMTYPYICESDVSGRPNQYFNINIKT